MQKDFFWNSKYGVRWMPLEIWTMVKYNGMVKARGDL
jgi:hypothetical protein